MSARYQGGEPLNHFCDDRRAPLAAGAASSNVNYLNDFVLGGLAYRLQ